MQIISLDEQVSVSGQIDVADVATLAASGIQVLVCNRPDNEALGQPLFSDIAKEAQRCGLTVVDIPFAGGQMRLEHVQAFAQLLEGESRIHAYCRTGNRSSNLWQAALNEG